MTQPSRIFSCLDRRARGAERPGQANGGDTGRMHDVEHKNTGVPPEQGSQQLHRVLTLREAVALGVGGTIGGGIFVLVGAAAGPAGPGGPLAFVLSLSVSFLIAPAFFQICCRLPPAWGGF